jgi:hypothetical protein
MTYATPSRRAFLRALIGGGAVLLFGGCGYYSPGQGEAYAPWRFPDGEVGDLRLIHAATLAANPHNIQPWLFQMEPNQVRVFVDESRSLGAMDPLGRERTIGLGCGVENLLIAARHLGRAPTLMAMPDPLTPALAATIGLVDAEPTREPLFDAIAQRRTNRGLYADFDLDPRIPEALTALIADLPDVALHILQTADEMSAFRHATLDATQAILDDTEMSEASDAWYRHSAEDIERFRDGVTIDAQSLSHLINVLGKVSARPSVAEGAAYWFNSTRDTHTVQNSAYLILSTPTLQDPASLLSVGRAYQRVHLWLTANGLAAHPLNQIAERRDRELQKALPAHFGPLLDGGFIPPNRKGQMLFRIGYAFEDALHSPRRRVTDTLLAPV